MLTDLLVSWITSAQSDRFLKLNALRCCGILDLCWEFFLHVKSAVLPWELFLSSWRKISLIYFFNSLLVCFIIINIRAFFRLNVDIAFPKSEHNGNVVWVKCNMDLLDPVGKKRTSYIYGKLTYIAVSLVWKPSFNAAKSNSSISSAIYPPRRTRGYWQYQISW